MNFLKKNNRFDSLKTDTTTTNSQQRRFQSSRSHHQSRREPIPPSHRPPSHRPPSHRPPSHRPSSSSLNIKKKIKFDITNELFPSLNTQAPATHAPATQALPLFKDVTKKKKEEQDEPLKPSSISAYPMKVLTKENCIMNDHPNVIKKSWYDKLTYRKLNTRIQQDIRRMIRVNRELDNIYGDTTPFNYYKTFGTQFMSKTNIKLDPDTNIHMYHHDEEDY